MTKQEFEAKVMQELHFESPNHQDLMDLTDFVSYWCESSLNGKKMRFEGQKYFDIKRRWGTWKRNSLTFKRNGLPKENVIDATLTAYNKAKKGLGL